MSIPPEVMSSGQTSAESPEAAGDDQFRWERRALKAEAEVARIHTALDAVVATCDALIAAERRQGRYTARPQGGLLTSAWKAIW